MQRALANIAHVLVHQLHFSHTFRIASTDILSRNTRLVNSVRMPALCVTRLLGRMFPFAVFMVTVQRACLIKQFHTMLV